MKSFYYFKVLKLCHLHIEQILHFYHSDITITLKPLK